MVGGGASDVRRSNTTTSASLASCQRACVVANPYSALAAQSPHPSSSHNILLTPTTAHLPGPGAGGRAPGSAPPEPSRAARAGPSAGPLSTPVVDWRGLRVQQRHWWRLQRSYLAHTRQQGWLSRQVLRRGWERQGVIESGCLGSAQNVRLTLPATPPPNPLTRVLEPQTGLQSRCQPINLAS